MVQTRESGAAAREFGLQMGRVLAKLLGAQKVRKGSNEIVWQGKKGVIKSCKSGTDQIGVTASMLPNLEAILGAKEDEVGNIEIWELSADDFRTVMYDSRNVAKGNLKMIRWREVERLGRRISQFSAEEVRSAIAI